MQVALKLEEPDGCQCSVGLSRTSCAMLAFFFKEYNSGSSIQVLPLK